MSLTLNGMRTGRAGATDLADFRAMLNEQPKQTDLVTELVETMKMQNKIKNDNMAFSRNGAKLACVFCACALRLHKKELEMLEMLKLIASVERQQQADEAKIDIETWADVVKYVEVKPRKEQADRISDEYERTHLNRTLSQWQDEVEATRKTDYPLY
jgi:hypothetical protein